MSTCTIRFLYNAENREFSLADVTPNQTVLSVKQAAVEKWPSGARSSRAPRAPRCASENTCAQSVLSHVV